MTVYVTNKIMRLKYLWIPIFLGMILVVSLFIFAPPVSALRSIDEIFGRVNPPPELAPFTQDRTGAGGISLFLSNLIKLIYAVAAIILVFMIIWGALEWLISGGDKEKIAAARARIVHALIGIVLFAIAFAVISVLGTFTGFTFFAGQGTGGGSGGPPAGVCTPGSFNRPCTGQCGGCAPNAGEARVFQCNSSGSAWNELQSECRPECVGPCTTLNCSYSQPDSSGNCSSGFEICTGWSGECTGLPPSECFNVPGLTCNYIPGISECTCSP